MAPRLALPWKSCEAALTETFHLLGTGGSPALAAALAQRLVICDFDLNLQVDYVLKLMQKYVDVPMSFADACLVRMTETLPDPILYTTDTDFRIYRRSAGQAVPCQMPS